MNEIVAMYFLAFTIGLTGAVVPGPMLVATINSSMKGGWEMGPRVVGGHMAIEAAVFIFILLGLSMLASDYTPYISGLGGIALVVFGVMTISSAGSGNAMQGAGMKTGSPYLAGVLTSASNPYFWIWWLTIGSAFLLDGLRSGVLFAVVFIAGHWSADLGFYTAVSTGVGKGRSFLSDRTYRGVLILCGIFLVLFGIYYLGASIPLPW